VASKNSLQTVKTAKLHPIGAFGGYSSSNVVLGPFAARMVIKGSMEHNHDFLLAL